MTCAAERGWRLYYVIEKIGAYNEESVKQEYIILKDMGMAVPKLEKQKAVYMQQDGRLCIQQYNHV